jgi:general secretion pathway protein K
VGGERTAERGAALLIVMVAVAVLTALAADLAYDSRVSLQIAANARNELQAGYLAKSGVTLGRLVLSFQREVDDAMSIGATVPGMPSIPRPQLWKLAPVNSELAGGLFGGSPRSRPETDAAPAGPAAGTFAVAIDNEARKVNAQLDGQTTGLLPAQVQAFWSLVCDPRWDPLFDREDADGQRYSRADLLIHLHDWVDIDETTSALAASFAPNGCFIALPQNPFENGFGDENFPYDRGEDRYRAKNARMDSLDELYLVAGVGDAFMAAFGDAITVYLPRDEKQDVNTTDPQALLRFARRMADRPDDPALLDATFLERLVKLVVDRTMSGMLAISPTDLADLVENAGVKVNRNVLTGGQAPFTGTSSIFRLRSSGRAGDVTKTLDVVVRVEKMQQAVVPIPGKILHWREE